MKKFGCKLLLFFISFSAWAQQMGASVSVMWDANTETNIAGYRVHWSTQTRLERPKYENIVEAGNKTFQTVSNLPYDTKIYLAATAYTTEGLESPYSNEITYTTPPFIPGIPVSPSIQNLRVIKDNGETSARLDLTGGVVGKTYTLQSSEDLENWKNEVDLTVTSSNDSKTVIISWPEAETPQKMFFRFKWVQ